MKHFCCYDRSVTDEEEADLPVPEFLAFYPEQLLLNTQQVCDLLSLSRGTWTSWVTKGYAPQKDRVFSGSPLWKLPTIIEYVRNSPGGRLGYPVG